MIVVNPSEVVVIDCVGYTKNADGSWAPMATGTCRRCAKPNQFSYADKSYDCKPHRRSSR